MDRRTFNKAISLSSLGCIIPMQNYKTSNSSFKMGYQLYSIRDEMDKNPIQTLDLLKEMGYIDFETYGYDATQDKFYGLDATEFYNILNERELSASSGHFGFSDHFFSTNDQLKHFIDDCIKGAKKINLKYITWPWLDPKYRNIEHFKLLADKLNLIGEHISGSGLGFAYHNHGYEFDYEDGLCGYDIIMNDTDPNLVKLQLDMYWLIHSSNYTPTEIIKKQPGRFVMWHVKDMDKLTRDYTELGNGSIDYLSLIPDAELSGLEYLYIEQGGNYTINSIESARSSAAYYKKNLAEKIRYY